mmetsp:Transcript_30733/g.60156  ORF Transcript_30733/g.60156 Transcript_30733/m.60156 type:complete len:233 (+) Transcript_30733:722-1420(+)
MDQRVAFGEQARHPELQPGPFELGVERALLRVVLFLVDHLQHPFLELPHLADPQKRIERSGILERRRRGLRRDAADIGEGKIRQPLDLHGAVSGIESPTRVDEAVEKSSCRAFHELREVNLKHFVHAHPLFLSREELDVIWEMLLAPDEVLPVPGVNLALGLARGLQLRSVGVVVLVVLHVLPDVLGGGAQPMEGDNGVLLVVREETAKLDVLRRVVQPRAQLRQVFLPCAG